MSRYLDPATDFGFKKLFGEEANKDIIMSFITDVLELEAPLLDLNFLDKEQLPEAYEDRSGVFDLYCKDVEGNRFIVEMQKNRIAFVKDRMLYYATFPIAAQAKKGKFDAQTFSPPETPRVSDVRFEYERKALLRLRVQGIRLGLAGRGVTLGEQRRRQQRQQQREEQDSVQVFPAFHQGSSAVPAQ